MERGGLTWSIIAGAGWSNRCVRRYLGLQCGWQTLLRHAVGVRIRAGHQYLHLID